MTLLGSENVLRLGYGNADRGTVDRQINRHVRFNVNYVGSRGVHLERSVNINAPVNGVYPYGDSGIRVLTEAVGYSRSNMLLVSPNVSVGKIFLFGFYGLYYGMDDNEGAPAKPYNLRAEWGPSSFADIRHRLLLGSSLPLPLKFTISPFFLVQSGAPLQYHHRHRFEWGRIRRRAAGADGRPEGL